MTTNDNLAAAFAGESQANRKYLAYGDAADREGLAQVARLFRAVAAAETIHAHAHLRAMGAIRTTLDNLQDAIAGEHHEFEEMYPGFIATAEAEDARQALTSFRQAMAVEKIHHGLFQQALEAVTAGRDLAAEAILVCPICGHTALGAAPDHCPVCNAKADRYVPID